MLKELVRDFCTGNDGTDGEAFLRVKQNVTDQKRFSGIFLTDDDNHWGFSRIQCTAFFYDLHAEFSNIKVHSVLTL